MKKALLRLSSAALAALGFVSCDFLDNDDNPEIFMYGTPMTEFTFKGKVTDASTAKSIENIRVIVQDSAIYVHNGPGPVPDVPIYYLRDTAYTDRDGKYLIVSRRHGRMQEVFRVFVESPAGDYEDQMIDLPILPEDYDRIGDWTSGLEKTLDVTLDPVE